MSTLSAARLRQEIVRERPMQDFVKYRIWLIAFSQSLLIVCSYYCSFVLRFDLPLSQDTARMFWETLPFILVVRLVVFYQFGLLRGWWRYVGMSDALNIIAAAFVSAICNFGLIQFVLKVAGFPRSIVFIDMVLTVAFVGGARFLVRAYTERAQRYEGQKNTLIVGAGQAGRSIAQQLRSSADHSYYPIGFVDDDATKQGIKINGLKAVSYTHLTLPTNREV